MAFELVLSVVAIIIAIIALVFSLRKTTSSTSKPNAAEPFSSTPLRLQAYERLVMLCERISLHNLISRTSLPQLSAQELQVSLLESTKQEFNYNVSQQIYVSQEAWEAVDTLKNQNILFINKTAASLQPGASGTDLAKKLLQDSINDKVGTLHTLVRNGLNEDAKKLMK